MSLRRPSRFADPVFMSTTAVDQRVDVRSGDGGLTADQVMTAGEVAELLQMPVTTAYYLANRGELPAKRLGRSWRFLRPRIDESPVVVAAVLRTLWHRYRRGRLSRQHSLCVQCVPVVVVGMRSGDRVGRRRAAGASRIQMRRWRATAGVCAPGPLWRRLGSHRERRAPTRGPRARLVHRAWMRDHSEEVRARHPRTFRRQVRCRRARSPRRAGRPGRSPRATAADRNERCCPPPCPRRRGIATNTGAIRGPRRCIRRSLSEISKGAVGAHRWCSSQASARPSVASCCGIRESGGLGRPWPCGCRFAHRTEAFGRQLRPDQGDSAAARGTNSG
jgi:excisionase family DNA binding protein